MDSARQETARVDLSVAAVVKAAMAAAFPAAAMGTGGAGVRRASVDDVVPVSLGGGEQVGEHRWRAGKLVGSSVRVEGGRRRELHGELGGGGGHGARRLLWCASRGSARLGGAGDGHGGRRCRGSSASARRTRLRERRGSE